MARISRTQVLKLLGQAQAMFISHMRKQLYKRVRYFKLISNDYSGLILTAARQIILQDKKRIDEFAKVTCQPLKQVHCATFPLWKNSDLYHPPVQSAEVFAHYGRKINFHMFLMHYQETDIEISVSIQYKHAYIWAQPESVSGNETHKNRLMCYNENELNHMLLHLYHPTPTQLYNLVKRVDPNEENTATRRIMKRISNGV